MKHISALLLLVSALNANAQLTNGSFEVNGTFSLEGWEWTCDDPQAVMDVPAGGGVWSAWKEAGHAKGCFPNELFQRLENVQYGIPYQLTGWVKCPVGDVAFCIGGGIGFGTISNGDFAFAQMTTSSDPEWAYITAEHVFDPGVGDTAIIVLNSGFIGGPIDPLPAGFDQLTLDIANGINEEHPLKISLFLEPLSDRLFVGSTSRMRSIECFDATGRSLVNQRASGTTEVVDLSALNSGAYLLRATTDGGTMTSRFVKR
jgi:hypothetical protein